MEEGRREVGRRKGGNLCIVRKITGETTRFPPNYCATTHDTSHCLAQTPESISMIRRQEPVCDIALHRFLPFMGDRTECKQLVGKQWERNR